jgi:hypothetical protein
VFDHDDCVRTARHWRARHDFDGLTWLQHEIRLLACADFAGDPQSTGNIGGPDRESVAHGAIKWRVIPIRWGILRQNAPESGIEPDDFCLR